MMPQMNPRPTPEGRAATLGPYTRCYDMATEFITCLIRVLTGTYSVVYLATPPSVTEQYLELLALCLRRPCALIAEKPWAISLESALRLEKVLEQSNIRVRCADHYLAKEVVRWLLKAPLTLLLGGPVLSVKAHLFETPGHLSSAMGTTGMLHDLLIHLVTVVHQLFPEERIKVKDAFGARHFSWPYPTESFARLLGVVDTGHSSVSVDLAAGKDCPSAEKVMIIEGVEATLFIDFAKDRAELEYRDGSRRLLFPESTMKLEKPYAYLLRRLHEGDMSIGLDYRAALVVLRALDDAKRLFPNPLLNYEKATLPQGQHSV